MQADRGRLKAGQATQELQIQVQVSPLPGRDWNRGLGVHRPTDSPDRKGLSDGKRHTSEQGVGDRWSQRFVQAMRYFLLCREGRTTQAERSYSDGSQHIELL